MSVPIEMINKKVTTSTYWVYTEAGWEKSKQLNVGNLENHKPGMPVPEHFRQKCPLWWFHNGWVKEHVEEAQLTLF